MATDAQDAAGRVDLHAPRRPAARGTCWFLAAAVATLSPASGHAADAPTCPGYIRQLAGEDAAARQQRQRLVAERRSRMVIMVHRGASAVAPENTLRAYAAAMDLGADGCEIDVRRSRDGVLYLMHDDTVDRVLEGQGKGQELTYYQLLNMPFRGVKKAQRETIRVPTLAAFLTLARQRAMLIHLDVKEPGLQDDIARILESADMWSHVVEVNAGNAERLRHHPRVRLKAYKGWFPQDGSEKDVDSVGRFLSRPGEMVFLKRDPTPAVQALDRKAPKPVPLPDGIEVLWCPAGPVP